MINNKIYIRSYLPPVENLAQLAKLGQKRVVRLKRRTINIGEYRKNKNYICIIAKKNYRITEEQIKSIKADLMNIKGLTNGKLAKLFKIRLLMIPNKILTKKGILVRMGGGKAKIKTKVLYLTTGANCIELIPYTTEFNKTVVIKLLDKFINKYTFLTYNFLL